VTIHSLSAFIKVAIVERERGKIDFTSFDCWCLGLDARQPISITVALSSFMSRMTYRGISMACRICELSSSRPFLEN
jgi:hypothetical protein